MLKQLGRYKPAMLSFQKFLGMYKQRDDLYRWARDEEVSCYWAIEHEQDTSLYEILRPDSGLNTVHAELSPFLFNEEIIYFSTMRYEDDEVKKRNPVFIEMQKAKKETDVWRPETLDLPIRDERAHVAQR